MGKARPDFVKAIRFGIKARMAELDWSPYELADRSGVSVNHIYRILRDEQSPSLKTTQKILRALGKTLVVVDEDWARNKRG